MSNVQTPMPRGGKAWTPAEDALIIQLREQRQSYTVVSQHVGKTPLACRLRMNALNRARRRASQRAGMTGARTSGGSAELAVSSNDNATDPAGSVTENAQRASEAQDNNSMIEEKVEAKEKAAEGCGEDSDQVMSGCA